SLRLSARNERRQAVGIARLIARLAALLLVASAVRALLAAAIGLLLALRERLRFARQVRLRLADAEWLLLSARSRRLGPPLFAVVHGVVALLLLGPIIRVGLAELFLRGGDQAEVMLSMLIVIFRPDRVTGRLRIACKLDVLVGDVRRGSTNLHVRAVRLIDARQRILALPVASAHALILTVSHGALFTYSLCGGCIAPPVSFPTLRRFARNDTPSGAREHTHPALSF